MMPAEPSRKRPRSPGAEAKPTKAEVDRNPLIDSLCLLFVKVPWRCVIVGIVTGPQCRFPGNSSLRKDFPELQTGRKSHGSGWARSAYHFGVSPHEPHSAGGVLMQRNFHSPS